MKSLRVVAAAVKDVDGLIFSVPPPGRHHDVLQLMFKRGRPQREGQLQGFVVSDGAHPRFSDRRQARTVAEAAGQLLPRDSRLEELYSEDVW